MRLPWWFDPDLVNQGDTIYLNLWYLDWFMRDVHDKIKHPYILVSGDVGNWLPFPSTKKLLYDPKLAAWFCRNMIFSYHPKLFPIPMGQDLALFQLNPSVIRNILSAFVKKPQAKKHLLYMCHYPRSFGDRDKIVKMFENESYCFSRNHSDQNWQETPVNIFYDDLLASKFVLSPLGLETDSVRTWEALALDCIPIVEHTFVDPIYEGLPVVKVHHWEEITEDFLKKKYEELKGLKSEKVYFDYWHNLLLETQKKVQEDPLAFSKMEATQFKHEDLEDLGFILKNKGGSRPFLVYKGALTSVKPLQLASAFSFLSSIFLYDPWLEKKGYQDFEEYLIDRTLLKNKNKVRIFESEKQFETIFNMWIWPCPIFLDLSYFRTAITINFDNFRHSLRKDLNDLYNKIKIGTLICGNMAQDEYVSEVLSFFREEHNVSIETRGSFWYFQK